MRWPILELFTWAESLVLSGATQLGLTPGYAGHLGLSVIFPLHLSTRVWIHWSCRPFGHLPSPPLNPCLDTLVIFPLHLSTHVWIHWSSRPFGHLPSPPLNPRVWIHWSSTPFGHLPSPPLNPCLDTLVIYAFRSSSLSTSQPMSGYTGHLGLSVIFPLHLSSRVWIHWSFRPFGRLPYPPLNPRVWIHWSSSLSISQPMSGYAGHLPSPPLNPPVMSGYAGHLPFPPLNPCLDTLVIFPLHLSTHVWIHWSSRPFGHLPSPPLNPCLDTLVIFPLHLSTHVWIRWSSSLSTSQPMSGYTGHLPSPPLNPCLDTLVI